MHVRFGSTSGGSSGAPESAGSSAPESATGSSLPESVSGKSGPESGEGMSDPESGAGSSAPASRFGEAPERGAHAATRLRAMLQARWFLIVSLLFEDLGFDQDGLARAALHADEHLSRVSAGGLVELDSPLDHAVGK